MVGVQQRARTAVTATVNTIPTITGYNPRLKMRNRHSYTWGYSKCGDNQLVCSLDRRHLSWNRYELYNTEYKYNDDILCRCNGWWVYNSDKDSSNSNS